MCPQSVKVLPYSQFVDTSFFWVKSHVSTKCQSVALQPVCGHIFLSQGSCIHKVWMWCPTDTMWTHIPEARVLCPQSVIWCPADTLWTHLPAARVLCPQSVMWCPTETLRTHLPESRVLCPQSVNVMSYRHLVDTSSWVKSPVSTKCECDVQQTLCGHTLPKQWSCVHKVSMWCPTYTFVDTSSRGKGHVSSVNAMFYRHFEDTSSHAKGHVSTNCQYDSLQTLCGHIFPRKGPCVHKVSDGWPVDTSWTRTTCIVPIG